MPHPTIRVPRHHATLFIHSTGIYEAVAEPHTVELGMLPVMDAPKPHPQLRRREEWRTETGAASVGLDEQIRDTVLHANHGHLFIISCRSIARLDQKASSRVVQDDLRIVAGRLQ